MPINNTGSVMSRVNMFQANGATAGPGHMTSRSLLLEKNRRAHPFYRAPAQQNDEYRGPKERPLRKTILKGDFVAPESRTDVEDVGSRDETISQTNARDGPLLPPIHKDRGRSPPNANDQAFSKDLDKSFTSSDASTKRSALSDPKRTVVELRWPSERLEEIIPSLTASASSSEESKRLNKTVTALLSDTPKSKESRLTRIQSMRARSPSLFKPNAELKRNLNAASVVLQEEKASSLSSGSSSRSSLSNDELGNIARRAVKLSKLKAETRASRIENSPLHQMMKEKRIRKTAISTSEIASIKKTLEMTSSFVQNNLSSSFDSNQPPNETSRRFANRLSRAERFAALAKPKQTLSKPIEDDSSIGTDTASEAAPVQKKSHPVFGYSTGMSPNDYSESVRRRPRPALVQAAKKSFPKDWKAVPLEVNTYEEKVEMFEPRSPQESAISKLTPSAASSQSNTSYNPPGSMTTFATQKKGESMSQISESTMSSFLNSNRVQRVKSLKESIDRIKQSRNTHSSVRANNAQSDQAYTRADISKEMPFSEEMLASSLKFLAYTAKIQDKRSNRNVPADPPNLCTESKSTKGSSSNDKSGSRESLRSGSEKRSKSGSKESSRSGSGSGVEKNAKRQKSDNSSSDAENSLLLGESILQLPSTEGNEVKVNNVRNSHSDSTAEAPLSQLQFEHSSNEDSRPRTGASKMRQKESTSEITGSRETFSPESKNTGKTSSSGSKSDALRWWQKNYGENVGENYDTGNRRGWPKFVQGKETVKTPSEKPENGRPMEEDDIFSGLDEDTVRQEEQAKIDKAAFDKTPSGADEENHLTESSYGAKNILSNPNPVETAARTILDPPVETQLFDVTTPDGRTGMVVDESRASNSVTSELTSSLIAGKARFVRKDVSNAVETIEEEPESAEEDQMDQSVQNEDDDDENEVSLREGEESVEDTAAGTIAHSHDDPPAQKQSVFLNIGCAIVDSFRRVCQSDDLPIKMDLECAARKDQCVSTVVDTWEQNTGTEVVAMNEDMTVLSNSWTSTLNPQDDKQTINSLNEEERRIWQAWENRDRLSAQDSSTVTSRHMSDSSASSIVKKRQRHEEGRLQAQKKLIEHANKALAIRSGVVELSMPSATGSFEKDKESHLQSPRTVSTTISFEDKSVLESFSSRLRHEGIMVLKLNRRYRWQIRHLSVSNEVTWLNIDGSNNGVGQCPKALLWTKRFNERSLTASNIRKNGRGGLVLSQLVTVEEVTSSEHYNKVPRRLKAQFPTLEGACLEYGFEGGHRTLLLCFQSNSDCRSFCAAMRILKEVIDRFSPIPDQSDTALLLPPEHMLSPKARQVIQESMVAASHSESVE